MYVYIYKTALINCLGSTAHEGKMWDFPVNKNISCCLQLLKGRLKLYKLSECSYEKQQLI